MLLLSAGSIWAVGCNDPSRKLFLATAGLGALNLECLEVILKINSFLAWLSEEPASAAIEAGQSFACTSATRTIVTVGPATSVPPVRTCCGHQN